MGTLLQSDEEPEGRVAAWRAQRQVNHDEVQPDADQAAYHRHRHHM